MSNYLPDEWKNEEDRSVVEILRGVPIGEQGGKSFYKIAESLYLLSETDYENRYVQKLADRAGSSDKSLGNYYEHLAEEGLVAPEDADKGDKKRYTLTSRGEYVLELISPLFRSLNRTYILENELRSFKERYFRNPTLEEISIFVSDNVEKKDLIKTGNWSPPEDNDFEAQRSAVRHIASGFVLANTDYNKVDEIRPYNDSEAPEVDSSFVIECSKVENPNNSYHDYCLTHYEFLTESLDADISAPKGAIIELDDISKKVLDRSKILINRGFTEKNDELKIALAD